MIMQKPQFLHLVKYFGGVSNIKGLIKADIFYQGKMYSLIRMVLMEKKRGRENVIIVSLDGIYNPRLEKLISRYNIWLDNLNRKR